MVHGRAVKTFTVQCSAFTLGRLHFGRRIPIEALLGGSSKVMWAQEEEGRREQMTKMKRTVAIPFASSQATGDYFRG